MPCTPPPTCLCSSPQLNLKQAQAVKFLTTIEEATGYDESLSTMYQLVQDSSLTDFFADKKTVATVFAPVDDVSWSDPAHRKWHASGIRHPSIRGLQN